MKFDVKQLKWTRVSENYSITNDKVFIITKPYTDLKQLLNVNAHGRQKPDEE